MVSVPGRGARAPTGGAFAEIGVYDGLTTLYLHRNLEGKGDPPVYYCIGTFSGFTDEDVLGERERGKAYDYKEIFVNSKERFQRTTQMNGLDRTVVVQADAGTFDYSSLPPLAFALLTWTSCAQCVPPWPGTGGGCSEGEY